MRIVSIDRLVSRLPKSVPKNALAYFFTKIASSESSLQSLVDLDRGRSVPQDGQAGDLLGPYSGVLKVAVVICHRGEESRYALDPGGPEDDLGRLDLGRHRGTEWGGWVGEPVDEIDDDQRGTGSESEVAPEASCGEGFHVVLARCHVRIFLEFATPKHCRQFGR